MAISPIRRRDGRRPKRETFLRLSPIMLLILGMVALIGALMSAVLIKRGTISHLVDYWHTFNQMPPCWLAAPMGTSVDVLLPTLILLPLVLLIMRVSPVPRSWSRLLVVGVLLALTIRYVLWRSLTTLNTNTILETMFSLGLLLMELLVISSNGIQLFLTLRSKDRKPQAEVFVRDVVNGRYLPSVDILIPTYDEPAFVLKRTMIGCQALEYPNKTVYLLDDTRRPEIQELARQLGCEYITRPDNRYAKAGNLNHALAHTQGDLVVVFDADFVPTANFLTRTVGFFQDPSIGLLQTHQAFYNPDPVARNLDLEAVLTHEVEVFSRYYQLLRDGSNSAICYGSSFVARRSALEKTGGFVTGSLSEDYYTGVRLSACGYQVIYLDEQLSAGLVPDTMSGHISQRQRWARGTLQAFFINVSPLFIPGLTLRQRVAHLDGIVQWLTSVCRVLFLLAPILYSFLGLVPIQITLDEWIYFFIPLYLIQVATFSWLNYHSRSAIMSDLYSVVTCIPIAVTVIQTLIRPFSKGFQVTPKGLVSDRFQFNWKLAAPLIGVFVLTLMGTGWNLYHLSGSPQGWQTLLNPVMTSEQIVAMKLGLIWSAYNLLIIAVALLVLIDAPRPRPYEWFDLRRTIQLTVGDQNFWGTTTLLSEIGADVTLTQVGFPGMQPDQPQSVTFTLLEEGLDIRGSAICTGFRGEFPTVQVMFDEVSLNQQRRLVELLFCRPGQWKRQQSPGELQSLGLLIRTLLRPRVLFNRHPTASVVSVSSV